MKLSELFNYSSAIQKLLKMDMPAKNAFQLSKFVISLNDQMKPYLETRNSLVIKYGKEENGVVTVSNENIEKFISEMDTIDEEFVGTIPEISIDDIKGDIDTETINSLHFLIK